MEQVRAGGGKVQETEGSHGSSRTLNSDKNCSPLGGGQSADIPETTSHICGK